MNVETVVKQVADYVKEHTGIQLELERYYDHFNMDPEYRKIMPDCLYKIDVKRGYVNVAFKRAVLSDSDSMRLVNANTIDMVMLIDVKLQDPEKTEYSDKEVAMLEIDPESNIILAMTYFRDKTALGNFDVHFEVDRAGQHIYRDKHFHG